MKIMSIVFLMVGHTVFSTTTLNLPIPHKANILFEKLQCAGGAGAIVIIPFQGGASIEINTKTRTEATITVHASSGEIIFEKSLAAPCHYSLFYSEFDCVDAYLTVEVRDESKGVEVTCE